MIIIFTKLFNSFFISLFLVLIFSNFSFSEQKKLKVVTTFTVIKDIVKNVAGDKASVISITKPGSEIHGYQPTPKDLVRTRDADLIISNGFNLEMWFEQFYSNFENTKRITLTDGVIPININQGDYEGDPNPHAWMSIENIFIYIENVKKGLIEIDPENKNYYLSNAINYKKNIEKEIFPLREKIRNLPKSKRWLVSCEGAFSYLAEDLNLKELYLWPINSESISKPKQIKKVVDAIILHKISAVFCESTVSQTPAKQLAKQTNSKYGGILYVDSLTEENGLVPTYIDLMKITSQTIFDGLR